MFYFWTKLQKCIIEYFDSGTSKEIWTVLLSTLRKSEDADEDEVMNFVKIAKENSMDYSIADEFT